MEETLMEKLLNDFNGVLNDFNKLVVNKDIEGIKKFLSAVDYLVQNGSNIQLDDREDGSYDHVLHELLSKIGGKVNLSELEKVETQVEEAVLDPDDYTYMGRLTDDQIKRRLLKEKLQLSDEEIEATIDDYKLVQYDDGSYDEEYDNPIAMRQLVKVTTVVEERPIEKQPEEQVEEPVLDPADYSYMGRLTDDQIKRRLLKEKLQLSDEEIEATIHEYKLVQYDDGSYDEEYDNSISMRQLVRVRNVRTVENKELKNQIDLLEQDIAELYNQGYVDTSPEIIKKREELLALQEQYYSSANSKGEDGQNKAETVFDIDAEVERIGDKIFKTADIRRELAKREYTREDFLEFYEKGQEMAYEKCEEIIKLTTEIDNELTELFVDENSEKSLVEQQMEAEENGNLEAEAEICEKIRQNFVKNGNYDENLESLGLLENEITTTEELNKFKSFYQKYLENAEKQRAELNNQRLEQKENLEIFEREIGIIKAEIEAEKVLENANEQEAEKEKELRARQTKATVYGDPELASEFDEKFKRFYSHKKTVTGTYIDANGEEKEIEYETVEDYPEMEEDALFLNLVDYKGNLELSSKYRNSGNDAYAINLGEEKDSLEAVEPGKGEKFVQGMAESAAAYVKSFNGLTSQHAVKYANYRTAGSTLKAMLPVRGDLPTTVKIGNAVSNTFRFFGIRKPEFTKVNANGEKVSNVKGALLTLAADAAVIGGVAVTGAIAGPIGLATWGVGYAAKGVVTAGNLIQARRYYGKYKYEIDNNIPNPYHTTNDGREVSRKDYYREVEGMGKFSSWIKAKTDRLPFFGKRAKETQDKIIARQIEKQNANIDEKNEAKIETARENVEIGRRNQEARESNIRSISMSQDTYNSMVANPDALNIEEIAGNIARNAALISNGGNAQEINPDASEVRKDQYVKEDEPLEQTESLHEYRNPNGNDLSFTAITEEQHYTARQQKQDRINKVWTMVLTTAGRLGLDAIRSGLEDQVKGADQEIKEQEAVYEERPITEKQEVVHDEIKTKLTIDKNKRLGDYTRKGKTYDNVYYDAGTATKHIKGGDIDGFVLATKDANGNTIEVSLSEMESLMKAGKHVHSEISGEFSDMTMVDAIKMLKKYDPASYEKYLKAAGLPDGASASRVATHAIKHGEFYTQVGAEGWQKLSPKELIETEVVKHVKGFEDVVVGTEKVFKGYEDITTVIPGNSQTAFSVDQAIDSAKDGVLVGAGIAGVDQLHEAADQTKKVQPGKFEDNNPELETLAIVRNLQERENNGVKSKTVESSEVEKDGSGLKILNVIKRLQQKHKEKRKEEKNTQVEQENDER